MLKPFGSKSERAEFREKYYDLCVQREALVRATRAAEGEIDSISHELCEMYNLAPDFADEIFEDHLDDIQMNAVLV